MIPSDLITTEEAAKRCFCSARTIRRAVETGKIDGWKPGAAIMVSFRSVQGWFETSKVKPRVKHGRPRKGARR